jgi:hypothetical protein
VSTDDLGTSTGRRGICPVCGQDRQLTKAGGMRMHLGGVVGELWRPNCDGVGMLPKSVVADPVAAALDLGRAAGWREAIEALRDSAGDQLLGHQRDGIHPCPCGRVRLGGSHTAHLAAVLADFLESLAPKEAG